MKKLIFVWILIGLFLASFPAFSGGKTEITPQAAAKTEPQGTVRFWHVWDGTRLELINQEVADFATLHPLIKIEHTLIDQKGLHQKYLTAIAGGDPADVLMLRSGEMPPYASKNALVSLNELVKRDKLDLEKIFYKAEIGTHYYKDNLYSMPVVAGGALFLLFYNKDLFSQTGLNTEKPPETWQELLDYSKKLTVRSGNKIDRIGYNPTAAGSYPPSTAFLQYLYTNNGQFMDNEGKKILFNGKEGLETLQYLLRFVKEVAGKYESIRGLGGADKGTNRLAFYNKSLAMDNEGNYHFYQMSKEAPDMKYGVGEMPYNGDNPQAAHLTPTEGGWGYAITAASKNHDAAWEWLKYVTIEDGAKKFVRAQGRPSPVRAFNEDPELAKNNPLWPVVIGALEHSVPMTSTTVQVKVKEILKEMEERVLFEKQTPQEGLSWAAGEVNKELQKAK